MSKVYDYYYSMEEYGEHEDAVVDDYIGLKCTLLNEKNNTEDTYVRIAKVPVVKGRLIDVIWEGNIGDIPYELDSYKIINYKTVDFKYTFPAQEGEFIFVEVNLLGASTAYNSNMGEVYFHLKEKYEGDKLMIFAFLKYMYEEMQKENEKPYVFDIYSKLCSVLAYEIANEEMVEKGYDMFFKKHTFYFNGNDFV